VLHQDFIRFCTLPCNQHFSMAKLPAKLRNKQFQSNVTKRGNVKQTERKESSSNLGPWMIGFFLFVVVGSGVFQLFQTLTASSLA